VINFIVMGPDFDRCFRFIVVAEATNFNYNQLVVEVSCRIAVVVEIALAKPSYKDYSTMDQGFVNTNSKAFG